MNKITGDLVRTGIKLVGAVLATVGLLPEQCGNAITADPTMPAITGTLLLVAGVVWGVISAKKAQNLHDAVDATKSLPPASVVEKEGVNAI